MEQVLTPEVIQVLVALLLALMSLATFKISEYLKTKAHGEKLSNVMWEVNEIVSAAVHEAEAVAVREAKDGGEWTPERQQRVKKEVVDKVSASLTVGTTKFVIKNFGDLTEYINGLVERQITENKVNGGTT